MNPIPVLLYHGISDKSSDWMAPYTVTPEMFRRHLDALGSRGYRCLTVSQLIDERANGALFKSGDKVALITFDDGYADFVDNAVPAMTERGLRSTMYVTSGWMEGGTTAPTTRPEDPFMSWSQLPDLPLAGVEIGSHSHTHPQMDTLDPVASLDELTRSKALIEDAIGSPVRSFAYPHGYSSSRIRRQLVQAGYDSGAAVRNALSHSEDNPMRLARLMLFSDTPFELVENWLDGKGAPVASKYEGVKTIGWRTYRRSKAILSGKAGTDYQ